MNACFIKKVEQVTKRNSLTCLISVGLVRLDMVSSKCFWKRKVCLELKKFQHQLYTYLTFICGLSWATSETFLWMFVTKLKLINLDRDQFLTRKHTLGINNSVGADNYCANRDKIVQLAELLMRCSPTLERGWHLFNSLIETETKLSWFSTILQNTKRLHLGLHEWICFFSPVAITCVGHEQGDMVMGQLTWYGWQTNLRQLSEITSNIHKWMGRGLCSHFDKMLGLESKCSISVVKLLRKSQRISTWSVPVILVFQ